MSTQKLRAIYKQLDDKINDSKEAAVFEIKELKTDLNELQRHLSGRKKATDIQPDDILRSAYEIAHCLREIRQRQAILDEMQDVAAETEAEEYLLSRGAKLLTRPVGWHFQTTKERFLLHRTDTVQAAAELRRLLAAGKRLKRPKKKTVEPKKPTKTAASAKVAETKTPATKIKTDKPAKAAKTKSSPKSAAAAKKTAPPKPKDTARPAKKAKAEKPAPAKKKKAPTKK